MTVPILETAPAPTIVPNRQRVLRKLLRDPLAIAASVYLILALAVAFLKPWITPFSSDHVDIGLTNAPPFGSVYFLGGDKYGRDVLSLLIAGAPDAFKSGAIFAVTALFIGIVSGLVAGYFGRAIDSAALWVSAVLMAVPGIIVLIALYTLVGVSTEVAMVTLGVLASPGIFLIVRTLTRSVRNELYVDAARVSGVSVTRIVGRHVLLAIRGPIIVLAAFLAGGAVAISAGLEFIGLGTTEVSWGRMLADAFSTYFNAPVAVVWPGLALGLTMAAFVLLGISLRDVLEGGASVRLGRRATQKRAARIAAQTAVVGSGDMAEVIDDSLMTADDVKTAADLVIEDLAIAYEIDDVAVRVVDGVSLRVGRGEIVGLVGESGSGKTQTVFAALGLLPESAVVCTGSITWRGRELLGDSSEPFKQLRGRELAYVPQEPGSNLDPNFTIGSQLIESIRATKRLSRREAKELALQLLDKVEIRNPRRLMRQYPFEISGGMAQRVLIAGAISASPSILIADEPTTALDVTVQAEVLDLIRRLQAEGQMSVLIVTHNLGVVADLCDRVVVMKEGRVVEQGTADAVLTSPRHPYTKSLVDAVLDIGETADDDRREPVREGASHA